MNRPLADSRLPPHGQNMNVYQLVPTPCYDDDNGVGSEFLSPGLLDDVDYGRNTTSGSWFYAADVAEGSGDSAAAAAEMGWYSLVCRDDDCKAASVLPVPHLLPAFDVGDGHHLRFFDDDDSSAENETFFGRTLDTISEEDEDDVLERAAAAANDAEVEEQRHERSTDLSKLAFTADHFARTFV